MGITQFNRAIQLRLGTLILDSSRAGPSQLRIAFEVNRDTTRYPNHASVQVWNLNLGSRARLEYELPNPLGVANVSLRVGYGLGMLDEIFLGQLRTVDSVHEGTDWVTTCTSGDSDAEVNFASVNQSFAPGTPLVAVFTALAKALKINPGNLAAAAAAAKTSGGAVLSRGLNLSGNAADALDSVCDACGYSWTIQNGTLQITWAAYPAHPTPLALISPQTGLIRARIVRVQDTDKTTGLAVTRKQLEGRCLMLPGLVPGRMFSMTSEAATGLFVCTQTKHTGDTHGTGDSWVVDFTAEELG